MIKSIFETLQFLFSFADEVRRMREELREVREAIAEVEENYALMAGAVRAVVKDAEHLKETEKLEREKNLLQLQLQLEKFERRLPPANNE